MSNPDPYAVVAEELAAGQMDRALWLKAFAAADGDDARTRATYVRARVAQIEAIQAAVIEAERKQVEQLRKKREMEQEAREEVARRERIEKDNALSLKILLILIAIVGVVIGAIALHAAH